MIPLVGACRSWSSPARPTEQVLGEVERGDRRPRCDIPIGTMIELPRAALTAGRIAEVAEFFSFGTNDLTQTTWGFSRDDVEAAFFASVPRAGIFGVSPFETIDRDGVGHWSRSP